MNETDNGYAIVERVFERSEMMAALRGLEQAAITRTKAGARHVLSVPVVRRLATDSRLRQVASGFVGPNAVPFRATLFDKSQSSNWLVVWHQDTALPLRGRTDSAEWGPWSVKSGVVYAHAETMTRRIACATPFVGVTRLQFGTSCRGTPGSVSGSTSPCLPSTRRRSWRTPTMPQSWMCCSSVAPTPAGASPSVQAVLACFRSRQDK